MSDTDAKIVLIGLAGLSERTLTRWASEGTMPNLESICRKSAVGPLASSRPAGTTVAWSSLLTGRNLPFHGVYDRDFVQGTQGLVRHAGPDRLSIPDLWSLVDQNRIDPHGPRRNLTFSAVATPTFRRSLVRGFSPPESLSSQSKTIAFTTGSVWKRRPRNVGEAEAMAARQISDFAIAVSAVRKADHPDSWKLLTIRFRCLAGFQRYLWPEISEVPGESGVRPEWASIVRTVQAALDDALGQLDEIAERRGAALLIVSENGFGPLRNLVNVNGILRIHGIQKPSASMHRLLRHSRTRLGRMHRRASSRLFGTPDGSYGEVLGGRNDCDWSRTLAYAPFGEDSGLIYLTPKARRHNQRSERVTLEIAEIFRLIADPATGDTVFSDVVPVGPRWNVDPVASGWPEIIAIPADGYQPAAEWRFKEKARIFRFDPGRPGAVYDTGAFVFGNGRIDPDAKLRGRIVDVAPTVLDHLGIPVPDAMDGSPIGRTPDRSIYHPHVRPEGGRWTTPADTHRTDSIRFPTP
jgi:predicted AlkP superfamily phosphohydrolase/phosphomutase